jgi:hypothetical protein
MTLFNNPEQRVILPYLLAAIRGSSRSLKIAVTWFTHHELFNEVLEKLNTPEFTVHLIVLNDRINNKRAGVDFQELVNRKGNFYYCDADAMVHHKFCIIDDEKVLTGSYNYSYPAANTNWENLAEITDRAIVRRFIDEFDLITRHHKKVENVQAARKLTDVFAADQFLQSDYAGQLENAMQQGDKPQAARILQEMIKLQPTVETYNESKKSILNELNKEKVLYLPFEIGIRFTNGYQKVFEAFSKLPLTLVEPRIGSDPYGHRERLNVPVEIFDASSGSNREVLAFKFDQLKPQPVNSEKIQIFLSIDTNAVLTMTCKELNGNNRIAHSQPVDLKLYINQ